MKKMMLFEMIVVNLVTLLTFHFMYKFTSNIAIEIQTKNLWVIPFGVVCSYLIYETRNIYKDYSNEVVS